MFAYANVDALPIYEERNKKIVGKIDRNYLDKGVLSYAGVMGLQADTGLTASQYTWLGSIYYAGYIVAAPIHNRAFQAFAPSKWIAGCVIAWGTVLACMCACHNFMGLMVQRTFLGALEACINTGFSLITASWYRKYEHGSRTGMWSSCTGMATMIGGLIAFGCVDGQTKHDTAISSWKILALITGLVSIAYGICMWFFMAPSAVEARFFSEAEKMQAVKRLRDNHQGAGSRQYKRYQAIEAFLDIGTWMYVVFVLSSQIPAAGLVLLQSILIKNLGFTTKATLLLNIPQGFISTLCNLGFGILADWTKQRSGSAIAAGIFSLFWAALSIGLGNVAPFYKKYGQLVAYFFMSGSCSTVRFIVISMLSSNVLGTTKKTTLNSIVFVVLGAAYCIGPQTFRDPPYYAHANISPIALWTLPILVLSGFYMLNRWENNKRDKLQTERGGVQEKGTANIEFMDLTDKENKLFRYVR
ncbi:major facilitator superfamily domain-containing protein [Clohesyomyces aquaticus]|uniref:Major facilitator superfamily domain-containing protein n=1 Tax=Clohesyomyces aquaticus TaxID=1231657 RepID=A0A1Y1ZIV5_9PLEO|nr:major facilitator superfamily domain-containing protein [Clohesyomyces aquaticus]